MSLISGAVARVVTGGKRAFKQGIAGVEAGHKIHIIELDENSKEIRKLYATTDKDGFFNIFVTPGRYRVKYIRQKEFKLDSGERAIIF